MARPRAWADLKFNVTIADAADMTPLDILVDLGASRLDTITIVRLVGQMAVVPDIPVASATSNQIIDVGIGVASEAAFVAGAVPQPDQTDEYPARGWLYVATKVLFRGNLDTVGEVYPTWEFDIRSMRKIDKGRLYLAAGNGLGDGTPSVIRFIGRIRALCLT